MCSAGELGMFGWDLCPRDLQFTPSAELFLHPIPVEVGDIEPEWAMFKASIAEAAAGSCGLKVIGTSRGGNPRTPWWTPVVREAVRLKKEAFLEFVIPGDS